MAEKPKPACRHEKIEVKHRIKYIEALDRYVLSVIVQCAQCQAYFRFLGLPRGVDLEGATLAVDGTTGLFGIYPENQTPKVLSPDTPVGMLIDPEPAGPDVSRN